MGMQRFITAAMSETVTDIDIVLDHRMDNIVPVDLDNPPRSRVQPTYVVRPILDLGPEGYWELDAYTQAVGTSPNLSLNSMPNLEGWGDEVQFHFMAEAWTSVDNAPVGICLLNTRDIENGVYISPFVATLGS